MIELFVKKPAMTIILIAVFMVLGIVSINQLIIEATPKVEFPIITIQTVYPGASPEEVETQIIKKIEDVISEVSEIKKIKSTARDSFGLVVVEFFIEADVNIKSIEIKDKMETILNDLPSGADRPIIAKFDPLIQPIMTLVLSSKDNDFVKLHEYADKTLKSRLSAISGVATVDIIGGYKRQVNIELDNNLLIQNYLSIQDIIRALQVKNLNVPGGSIDRSESKTSIRFVGEFSSIEDIKNLWVSSREGRTLKLSDLGLVTDAYDDIDKIARFNGEEVVALAVKKLSDGDAVKIAKILKLKVPELSKSLPKGMELRIANDTTKTTLSDTKKTVQNIILGIFLTVFIILIFLGDWRGSFIASIVIPTSIISTFFLMGISDFSINVMTLLAFGTALGTLISNALLIIENVYKHLGMGKDSQRAAIDGTKEVLLAVFASAGTNLVVFTPLSFMGGIVGQFMVQFGLTVVFATLFSILASVTLTPMLCGLLLKNTDKRKGPFPIIASFNNKIIHWMIGQYRYFFDFMTKRPIISIILIVAFFLTIIFPASRLGSEFVSKSDRDDLKIYVSMPDGTPVKKTSKVVHLIYKTLKEYSEVESVLDDIGYNGEETARITVNLIPAHSRSRSYTDLIDSIVPKISNIPDALIMVTGGDRQTTNEGDLSINIKGNDFEVMRKVTYKIRSLMIKTGYFSSIENSYKIPKMELQFFPDAKKIIEQGLTNAQVGTVIRSLVNGNDDSVYKENSEEYDINIVLASEFQKNISDFDNFLIHGKDGLIPISSLGTMKLVKATSPLKRRDKVRVINLKGYLSKSTSGPVRRELDKLITEMGLPAGISYAYTGNAENESESQKELGKAFILAILLTYMLLVAILNSFVLPISIGVAIVTSFLGSFLLMFFTGESINIGSMMAMVMLVGLTVNNAILMIEFVQQKISEGIDIRIALWQGASTKLKPILMTSIAIIVGILPQLFDIDKIKSSMGAVIVGGMIGSVFFTYFFVPAVFILINDIKMLFKRKVK